MTTLPLLHAAGECPPKTRKETFAASFLAVSVHDELPTIHTYRITYKTHDRHHSAMILSSSTFRRTSNSRKREQKATDNSRCRTRKPFSKPARARTTCHSGHLHDSDSSYTNGIRNIRMGSSRLWARLNPSQQFPDAGLRLRWITDKLSITNVSLHKKGFQH
ncbi:hypothetical protein BU16DRAFT_289679 [Lophium mytilinum]|uniref:Uncharacterized protein n=1 Tax=Lophium mytilinum TaxID=390894 RepID=A0A6A6R0S2_9PEZI|nr:hypothetical protein BU16DRAFT_289679 [Lophium mytilinum]